eukprot:14993273-Ditylum_brightwellii.AAC.1
MKGDDCSSDDNSSCIKVAVRIRPFLPIESGSKSCVEVLPDEPNPANDDDQDGIGKVIQIGSGKNKDTSFTFDHALSGNVSQNLVFITCVLPLLESCLDGYNATVLAYGQTGAGKTYSVLGAATRASMSKMEQGELDDSAGIIPRALHEVFLRLNERKQQEHRSSSFEFQVRIQFLELYGEEIRDLLASTTTPD